MLLLLFLLISSSNQIEQQFCGYHLFERCWVVRILNTLEMQNQMVVSKVKKPMEEPDVNFLKVDVSHHFVTDQIFDSRAHVVKWCREVGSKIKVVVVTVKSDQPTSRRSGRLVLGCARGGVPRDYNKPGQKKKVKETQEIKTKKCGCPFTLRGVPLPEDKWKLKVQCGEHNHPIETALVGHSYFGRLSCEEERIGSEMTECKVKSRGVLKTIKKENRTSLSSMRKIYYTRANIRLTDRVPRLSMEEIESILSKTNIKIFPFDTTLDVQKRKSRLGRKYIEAFPESMKVYINDIHEIKGDGNCGFRAVAELIGLRDEDAWQKVRTDLMVEVINNSQQYTKMFGNELLNEIINSLMCFDSPCQRANWMCMPYTGYLIASAYKVVFVFLSKQQCITFFPTRDSPIPGLPHRLITVGYVYDCHYVSVYLKPDAPIPPIASLWLNHHNEAADIWPTTYIGRIRVFLEIIPPEVVTSDHFEIDD